MHVTGKLSPGLKALPRLNTTSFASTQAAWRFYKNDKVNLQQLSAPLLDEAHKGISSCKEYGLCIHDWSHIKYITHKSKKDKYKITHDKDVGYELQSSILINDVTGQPIAPLAQRLITATKSYATYNTSCTNNSAKHLDELTACIGWLKEQQFSKPLVHIIDREADSIGHIRQWEEYGSMWLTRVRKNSIISYSGESMRADHIADKLDFRKATKVSYKGNKLWQYVAETSVVIDRASRPSNKKTKPTRVYGKPVAATFVVSRILSSKGEVMAQWLLITNVQNVKASTVSLWYYWRWSIESWFKLLKQGGHDLESWQQTTGLAIAKRLLVVSMACVFVWQIASSTDKNTTMFRDLLVKLSGRQMKYKTQYTNNALLAGLWVFLSITELLHDYSTEDLENMKHAFKKILV